MWKIYLDNEKQLLDAHNFLTKRHKEELDRKKTNTKSTKKIENKTSQTFNQPTLINKK